MNVIPQVPETIIENDIENEMREEESSEGRNGAVPSELDIGIMPLKRRKLIEEEKLDPDTGRDGLGQELAPRRPETWCKAGV